MIYLNPTENSEVGCYFEELFEKIEYNKNIQMKISFENIECSKEIFYELNGGKCL